MATQTGSIDLTATNSVKLFAAAGFKTAEQTYATKGELEVTNDAVALRATKTEASQMAQPNLSPFFSMAPTNVYNATTNPDGYWDNDKTSGVTLEQLADGWWHINFSNTTTGNRWFTIYEHCAWRHKAGDLKGSTKYTVMFEFRNVTKTGSVTCIGTTQHATSWPSMFIGNSEQGNVGVADGVQYHVGTTVADPASVTGSACTTRTLITFAAGSSLDAEFRVSLYEGEYAGPYKPYSGDMMYATNSELKVTADGIMSEVEKVSSAKYVDSLTTSWTLANIKTYAAEGHAENWNVSSTADLRVGDTVYVKGTDSTRNCTVYIKTTVTQIRSASNFRGTSHGYEDVLPVETIKSTINQSSDSVKIAANHVNIEGAAIFTSGRLSEEELNSTYDANGAAAAVQDNLDNLEIGGRNLLRYVVHNYADANGVIGVSSSYRGMYCAVDGGETYTISRRMIEGNRFWIEWSEQEPASGVILNPLSRDNTALKVTVDVPSEANWLFIYLSNQSDVINDGNIKVERGTKATDWTPATEDMASQTDLIGVRGRNLLRGTKDWSGSNGGASSITIGPDMYDGVYVASYTYTNTGNYVDFRSWNNSVVPKSDTYYTLSFWVKASEDIDYIYSYFYRSGAGPVERGYNSSGNTTVSADGAIATNVTTEWQRVWITWKTLKDISSDARSIIVARMYKAKMDGATIYLAGVMFQEGNRGTAWECAPEDVDASIDANSTGLGIKWNYSAFSTANNGEAYICAWDASTGTFTDAAGWVWFNGTKRTVPKGMVNPNSWGNNRTVYVVCRLTSATATTGTNYIVWYDSGWKYNDKGISQSTTGAAIADWTWVNTTDMVLASFVMLDADTSGMVDCQQYTPPLTSQQVTNGDTAYTKAAAAQATANAAAPKANAVKRTQRIYYRTQSSTRPTAESMPTAWVTQTGNKWSSTNTSTANWTTKVTPILDPSNSSAVKNLYLWTCEQREMADGSIAYTNVLLDDSTTVIDGGNIITGSVKANSIDAASGTFSTANIPELTADHIKASVISAVNNGTGTINADKINVSAIKIGDLTNDAGFITDDDIPDPTDFYGTCATAAGTAAKVVVCDGFVDSVGARLTVKFTVANTQNVPTLTIEDDSGSTLLANAAVWYNNAVASSSNIIRWGANAILHFIWDGTVWHLDEKPPSYQATSSTGATTRAKSASVTGALVVNGTRATVRFSTANTYATSSVQLTFSGTGALSVYRDNLVTSATNQLLWDANTVLTFVLQGTGWYLADNGTRTMSEDAAKTATNYISADSTGIKIANANPATATTYQHLTATSTEFVVDSDSMLELDGTNGARVGKEDGINTCVGSGGFYIRDSNDVRAGFEYEAASGSHPGNTTIESSDGLKLYGNVSSIDGTETGRAYILLSGTRHNRDSEEASVAIVANSDPDNSSGDGNGSHIAAIHLAGGNTSGDSIPSGEPRVSIHVGGESFDIGKPTSLYSTGSVSVANQSWVSVANLTIPSTGTWMVVVTGDFAANATGRRVMACTRNAAPSSTPAYDSQNSLIMAPVNGAATKFNSSAIIDFDAGDVYYAGVWQNSGSALTTQIMIKAVRLI